MKQLVNNFSSYEFTDAEMILASTFTALNLKYLQTMLADAMTEKMNLAYNPESKNADREFQLAHEYLRGQIVTYTLLINTSLNNDAKLAAKLQGQQESQAKS